MLWYNNIGSKSIEECNSVVETTDGGFIIVGQTDPRGEDTKGILEIYNIDGQLVQEIDFKTDNNGSFRYSWDAKDQCSGLYICRAITDKEMITSKLILLK